jgi:hypothetical protein
MDDESLDEIARQLPPLGEVEQAELLLTYFARIIETMDTATLHAFRAHCARRSEGTEIENTMLDVLDGQIALRQLGVEERNEHD